jgi:H+/Na+-translocating ferredoxin:NAD+ oxidoreductase subunit E
MSNPAEKVPPLDMDTFLTGIWRENPVLVMMLGMCPTMAVTNSVVNSLAMGLATTFVLIGSNALVSMLRRVVPGTVRIATYIVIIATFVTVVDYAIQAISLTLYEALGAFIQLIVVNCIILGRAEAFASKRPVLHTIVNSAGVGIGFTFGLFLLGGVRELLGAGTFLGVSVFGSQFQPWVIMVLPPGGFFVLGAWLLLFNWLRVRRGQPLAKPVEAHSHGA